MLLIEVNWSILLNVSINERIHDLQGNQGYSPKLLWLSLEKSTLQRKNRMLWGFPSLVSCHPLQSYIVLVVDFHNKPCPVAGVAPGEG